MQMFLWEKGARCSTRWGWAQPFLSLAQISAICWNWYDLWYRSWVPKGTTLQYELGSICVVTLLATQVW